MGVQLTLTGRGALKTPRSTAGEEMENILAWRVDPAVGLRERYTELISAGWQEGQARRMVCWLLAYRLAWVETMWKRSTTTGLWVSLTAVQRHMGRAEAYDFVTGG